MTICIGKIVNKYIGWYKDVLKIQKFNSASPIAQISLRLGITEQIKKNGKRFRPREACLKLRFLLGLFQWEMVNIVISIELV